MFACKGTQQVPVSSYLKEIIVKKGNMLIDKKRSTENISQLYKNVVYHKITTIEEKYVDVKTLIMLAKVGDYECHVQLLWRNIYPIRRPVASSGEALMGQSGASLVPGVCPGSLSVWCVTPSCIVQHWMVS